jgi:hypothetical protein
MARKPMKGNAAQNVLSYGTGGINIDGTRVPLVDGDTVKQTTVRQKGEGRARIYGNSGEYSTKPSPLGRYPANILLSYDDDGFTVTCMGDADKAATEEAAEWVNKQGYTLPLSREEMESAPENIKHFFR